MSESVAILSAAITVLALVMAIFGASWLNQRNIGLLLDQLEKRIDAKFAAFDARFETVLAEIKRVDQRIDSVEQRLQRIDRQLEAIFQPVLPER
jgi:Tfp pilus assembly protein PilN